MLFRSYPIFPVRYITNHSTGKMGYAVAKAAALRGAEVTLVSAHTEVAPPRFVKLVQVTSARDMFEAVKAAAADQDVIVKAAAVADYRPAEVSDQKVKKKDGDLSIRLERTDDILAWLGDHRREGQFLCGFSMETKDLLENSAKKLGGKTADMILANDLNVEGAGFAVTTNVATIITKDGAEPLELMTKGELSDIVLSRALDLYNQKHNG